MDILYKYSKVSKTIFFPLAGETPIKFSSINQSEINNCIQSSFLYIGDRFIEDRKKSIISIRRNGNRRESATSTDSLDINNSNNINIPLA